MNTYEELERHFETILSAGNVSSGSRSLPGGVDIAFATNVGIVRSENQDRVAVFRGQLNSRPSSAFLAFVVADGMGGMVAGAECATLAVSAFFAKLISSPQQISESSLTSALRYSNQRVNVRFNGRGGSTFTAIIVDNLGAPWLVHVGDSRAYSFSGGKFGHLEQLSIDDTLSAIIRANSPENNHDEGQNSLLQFVGMGDDLSPHVFRLDIDLGSHSFLLTSDGIHFLGSDIIQKILRHADNANDACDRLIKVAVWMSGHDNGSVIVIRPPTISKFLEAKNRRQSVCSVWSIAQFTEFMALPINVEYSVVKAADESGSAVSIRDQRAPLRTVDVERKKNKKRRGDVISGSVRRKKTGKSEKTERQNLPQLRINLIEPDDDKS